mmetsp:Transcript_11968/g.31308  ORF Transcript_11968/g.31308 Transcript_11968/m.31308 type:complete len:306 (-) Transcript_11968:1462-2379(-)
MATCAGTRPCMRWSHSGLEAGEGRVGDGRHALLVRLGDVVIAPARSRRYFLGHAGAHKLVLGVQHEELKAGQPTQRLGHGEHLVLERLLGRLLVLGRVGVVARAGLVVEPERGGERHVGSAVADAHDHHVARVAALLRGQAHLHRVGERVRERRAAAARHALQPVLRHRDRARGRQQHRRRLALESDECNLVAALVRGGEQVDRGALGRVHPVERHRAARVDDEDDEAARLARHLLGSHVRLLDVHRLGLGRAEALPARALERRGGAHRGVDGEPAHLALGQHRLDVPTAVLREDEVAFARLARL